MYTTTLDDSTTYFRAASPTAARPEPRARATRPEPRTGHDTNAAKRSATVLLLLTHSSLTLVAIRRAVRIANQTQCDLHVALVLPPGCPQGHPAVLAREVDALVARQRKTRPYRLDVVHGEPVAVGAALARTLSPSLVVVDGAFVREDACRLVERAQVPVLVAKVARPSGAVIAATDTTQDELPVVTFACGLAQPLARSLAVVRRERAAAVTEIVAAARECDADIVVVGHRESSWFGRWLGRDLADRLVALCPRSIVIVPV